jgi:hypothetical protein
LGHEVIFCEAELRFLPLFLEKEEYHHEVLELYLSRRREPALDYVI